MRKFNFFSDLKTFANHTHKLHNPFILTRKCSPFLTNFLIQLFQKKKKNPDPIHPSYLSETFSHC